MLKTDSRSPYVHRLTLYDHDGKVIDPKDEPAVPYSPAMTCAKCHPVGQIAHGWHFNAWDPNVPAGRPGEPWILVDQRTGTVLPLSGRHWPGTFTPAEAGLSPWQFVLHFGGHTPGGGFGDPDKELVANLREAARWRVSGRLEIDCMFCHSADQQHDPAEAARQIEAQNFRWAPTAALGLGVVRGEARKAPDDWDPSLPPDPDYPEQAGPKLIYDRKRFDPDNRVLFNITRRPSVDRCYFCHSFREVGADAPEDLLASRDVHLAAGLICVDCHRNDVDHDMVRGYAGEAAQRNQPWRAAFTCDGCHLGTADDRDAEVTLGGRYGAPHPEHEGLPPVHFQKLTCTACHSGPWPSSHTRRLQTALAHGLGFPTKDRTADALPAIAAPVFVREADGKIEPQRLAMPSFWGQQQGEQIVPMPLEVVERVGKKLARLAGNDASSEQAMLAALAADKTVTGEPVYLALRPGATAGVTPSTWPMAHDVRPAAQALGARGCTDCHAAEAPFFFGTVTLSARPTDSIHLPMWQFCDYAPQLASAWGLGFRFRPAFKWFGFICAGLVALVLLQFALDCVIGRVYAPAAPVQQMSAAGLLTPPRGLTAWEHVFHTLATAGLVIEAVTGFGPKLVGAELAGWTLLVHMVGAPLFTLGLAGAALQWAGRCRFGRRSELAPTPLGLRQKQMFWLMLAIGFVVMLTMLAAMLPVFGADAQETLKEVHNYSTLVLLIAMVPHTIVSWAARRMRGKAR